MKRSPLRRRNKYRAIKTMRDNVLFDSKLEAAHYDMLKAQLLAGEIKDLDLQHEFHLKVADKHICTYIADYFYYDVRAEKWVVSDAKGVETDTFKLKWKLVRALYPEFILELRKKWKITRS